MTVSRSEGERISLTDKEKLEQLAYDEGILIDYVDFSSERLCGLYVDGSIALKKGMDDEKTTDILAEELGHHFTTVGNIVKIKDTSDMKQEQNARLYAYNLRIGLTGLLCAFKAHCQTAYDIAKYLGVSEEFLLEAIERYRQIYGIGTMVDNYYIRFEPTLQVLSYHIVE